jgi:hypothetical protein
MSVQRTVHTLTITPCLTISLIFPLLPFPPLSSPLLSSPPLPSPLLYQAARNAEIAAASGINTPATITKIMNCTADAVSVLFESIKEGSSVDAENIAAAVTYLDASHGCVLQSSSAMLFDSEGERAKGKQKKEWSRDTTTATTSSTTSSSASPSARTGTSTSTDSNTDSSPLIAKQKQSQGPGVFDINTGSTAYPVSSIPSTSVSLTASEDLQMSPISGTSSSSSSSGSSSSDSGNSRASSKGVGKGKSSKLTEDEEMLLNMLTSTHENGDDKGILLHTLLILFVPSHNETTDCVND